jgi:hypothetical protein
VVLRREGDAVVAIGQPSHAWLSGQLARAWGNERFGAVRPWEEVCLAAEQHDIGMAAWDAAPALNPDTGLPYSFVEMPIETHVELWDRAWELVLPQSRYAALLVSMHGEALYRLRDLERLPPEEAARIRDYLTGQHALQAGLTADLGADREQLRRNQRLLWTWDYLSLALCLGWAPCSTPETPTAGEPVALRLEPSGGARFTLDPWPFGRPAVTVRTEGRRLTGRFTDEAALHLALARAQGEMLAFELIPA